jgi:hypothetical protein
MSEDKKESKLDSLLEKIWTFVGEVLQKSKCVRCGANVPGGSKGSRCKACMDKLTRKRHTPGSTERAQRKADDAKRRERGKNGTATVKSKGRMKDRKKFVKDFKASEKKAGEKLSPDRKNIKNGYESKNVRNIPEKLNRGRHNADEKKIREWKKKLKKNDISTEELATLMVAKASEKGED